MNIEQVSRNLLEMSSAESSFVSVYDDNTECLSQQSDCSVKSTDINTIDTVTLSDASVPGTKEKVSATHISALPEEMMLKILSYLDIYNISFSVPHVCNYWNKLSQDSSLWTELMLVCPQHMINSKVYFMFQRCPKLRNIRLQWRTDTNDILTALTHYCKALQRIEVICCGGCLQRQTVSMLTDAYPNLKHLSFGKCWSYEKDCFEDVWKFSMLQSLDLCHCNLSGSALHKIADNCPFLININLDNVKYFKDKDLSYLIKKKRENLLSLCISGELLTDSVYLLFSECTKLEKLHISSCDFLSDKGLAAITKCTSLISLKLRYAPKVTLGALKQFLNSKTASQLKYLSLNRNECFDDVCASIIASNCSSLEELDLLNCPAYTDNIKECIFKGCKKLKIIYSNDNLLK